MMVVVLQKPHKALAEAEKHLKRARRRIGTAWRCVEEAKVQLLKQDKTHAEKQS